MVKRFHLAVLGLICLLLVGLIYFLHSRDKTDLEAQILLDADDVVRIEIQSVPAQTVASGSSAQASQVLVLNRENTTWKLAPSPSTAAANETAGTENSAAEDEAQPVDSHRVTPLLELLKLPQRQSYSLNEIDQQELGLDPPNARLQINDLIFLFGDKTADGSARYVLVNDAVHLYPEFVYPLIRAGKQAFVSP